MNVLVPIANGTEEMEAVIIVDMLRRAGLNVIVAGNSDVVTCSRGIRIVPDKRFEYINEDDHFDAIVLPGGQQGVEEFISSSVLEQILKRHTKSKGITAAICAAPIVLHEFGLLTSKATVTSHPSVEQDLASYTYVLDRVARDGQIITSRGAGTAFEFTLALITALTDSTIATRIATDIVLYE